MSANWKVEIRGIRRAQAAMQRAFRAVRVSGGLGRAVKEVTYEAHRAAKKNTPWDTTALRHSHRIRWVRVGERAVIDIDRSTRNPKQPRKKPYVYGYTLHQQGYIPGVRGGIRAFYRYTVEREGGRILQRAGRVIWRALP
jgi:hypothetical protein